MADSVPLVPGTAHLRGSCELDGPCAAPSRGPPRGRATARLVGVFMAFMDDTVVGIAFPNLVHSFPQASFAQLSWVLNTYNIAFAVGLVPAGRLADLIGRRRLFNAGLVLFTIASALCASAPSVAALIAMRALQGIGAALIVPSSLALVLESSTAERRLFALSAWSATAALAAGIGPSIGGVLVDLSELAPGVPDQRARGGRGVVLLTP